MVLDDFGTSLPFIDIYLSTLDNQDTTICKSVPAPLAQGDQAFPSPQASSRVGPWQVPWESRGAVADVQGECREALLGKCTTPCMRRACVAVDGPVAQRPLLPCPSPACSDWPFRLFRPLLTTPFTEVRRKSAGWQGRSWGLWPGSDSYLSL